MWELQLSNAVLTPGNGTTTVNFSALSSTADYLTLGRKYRQRNGPKSPNSMVVRER